MSEKPSRAASSRWIPSIAVFIWLALALFIAWAGTLPDEYLIYVRGITDAQPYPLGAVVIEIGILALSVGLLGWAAMACRWKRVGRTLIALIVTSTVGIFSAMGAMHMPEHFVYFALSMLAIAATSLLAVVILSASCLLGLRKMIRESETRA